MSFWFRVYIIYLFPQFKKPLCQTIQLILTSPRFFSTNHPFLVRAIFPPKTPRATKTQLPVAYLLGKSRRCCHPNRHSPNPNPWSSKDMDVWWMVGGCVWWRAYRFTPVSYASCYNKNKDQWHNMMKNNIVWDSQLNWVTNKGITSTLGTRTSFLKEVFEKKTGTHWACLNHWKLKSMSLGVWFRSVRSTSEKDSLNRKKVEKSCVQGLFCWYCGLI